MDYGLLAANTNQLLKVFDMNDYNGIFFCALTLVILSFILQFVLLFGLFKLEELEKKLAKQIETNTESKDDVENAGDKALRVFLKKIMNSLL